MVLIKIEVILILFQTFRFEIFRHMWRKANGLDNAEIDNHVMDQMSIYHNLFLIYNATQLQILIGVLN